MNLRKLLTLGLPVVLLVALVWSLGGAGSVHAPPTAPIEGVTRPQFDAQLGFPITGRVGRVLVKPGDLVKKGQELIVLEDEIPRAQFELLKMRAESVLEIDAAKADWDLAKLQRQLVSESFDRRAATALEVERMVLEAEKARLALELFKQRHQEAQRQLVEGQERLSQYTLRSPRDGVVDRLVTEPGEVVQEQRPVLRLVDIATLRVDAAVPTARTLGLKPGQRVWVSYQEDGEAADKRISASVVSLAAVADSASDTRLVRIEFENSANSPAGRSVYVWIQAE